jgi:hypothetical protein
MRERERERKGGKRKEKRLNSSKYCCYAIGITTSSVTIDFVARTRGFALSLTWSLTRTFSAK